MMEKELSCAVVRDLLPLYVERLVSEETRGKIEKHLTECAACRDALETLQNTTPTAPQIDAAPLKNIRRRIRLGEWLIAALSGMLVLAISGVVILHVWTVEYSYADIAEKAVYATDHDKRIIRYVIEDMPEVTVIHYNWTDDPDSIALDQHTDSSGKTVRQAISLKTSLWNHLFAPHSTLELAQTQRRPMSAEMAEKIPQLSSKKDVATTRYIIEHPNIWYIDPDGQTLLLFDNDTANDKYLEILDALRQNNS